MKILSKIPLLFTLVLVLALMFPTQAFAQGPDDGKVVVGGSYTLEEDDTLDGDLAIFGGTAILEEGSTVNGAIVISGGSLTINGTVDGDVTAIGGNVVLGSTSVIDGDVNVVGGNLSKEDGYTVDGRINIGQPGDFEFDVPNVPSIREPGRVDFSPIGDFMWGIFRALALSALAMLVALFVVQPTQRVKSHIISQPVMAGAFGLLTLVVAPALIVVLSITLILIPVALVGILLLGIAVVYGWIVVGLEVGNRMANLFRVTWSDPVAAGIGTLTLTLVASMIGIIPCVGWIGWFIIGMIGLGAVILSRFGTRSYAAPVVAHVAPATVTVVESPAPTSTYVSEPEPPASPDPEVRPDGEKKDPETPSE